MNEKQLVKKCKKGDTSAIKLLYEIYAPKMLGVCFRYAGNMSVAEDLLHDGFIVAITKISSFRDEGSFEGWLRRIFVTTSLQHLRNELKIGNNTTDIDQVIGLKDSALDAIEAMSSRELTDYINRLPDGYRVVLNMYAVEGYSHKEIAQELNISEGTSRSQYLRARASLQKLLEQDKVI